jgi:16S rRNA (cytosine967-C5)-methyltransferase
MVEEWRTTLRGELDDLLAMLNTPSPTTLRVNTLKATRDACRERLRSEGIESEPTKFSPSGLNVARRFNSQSLQSYRDGWFEFQDEGSQLVSLIANPGPGSTIIDACAGAGGKSLHLAALTGDNGAILAMDVSRARLRELEARASRAGLGSIRTMLAENLSPAPAVAGALSTVPAADLVLVDAPCSGVGTIRRNPGLKWSVTQSQVERHAERQLALLTRNAQSVKAGGRLVFVTCSLLRKENEDTVAGFLASGEGSRFGPDSAAAVPAGISPSAPGCFTLFPHRYGTDGFFIALLKAS